MPKKIVKPILGITLGDPAGIGPEVTVKSLADEKIYQRCRPLVIGDAQILSLRRYGVPLRIRPILNSAQAQFRFGTVDVLHLPGPYLSKPSGKDSQAGGIASSDAVKKSVELALTGLVHGIVHAPISKLSWQMAGVRYSGHTEFIAELCGVKKVAMAIVSEPLRTVMVTRHIPLKEVASHLKEQEIADTIELTVRWMKRSGIKRPRIGVCALNPHAGEKGLLGNDEIRTIGPAVRRMQKKFGREIRGPLPADAAFRDHKNGLYDCLITMYHDQSLIPLKLFNADKLVNVTLGLPFPRTSPGHGTAFEIAGKNRANPLPMTEAILTAAKLCS